MAASKPRVIIADTDINYLIPIQLKFLVDFGEKIELEVITDPEYFKELFSDPQSAEILIISEDLYSDLLQKHTINNVFVMTEQYEEEQTGGLFVNKIYKYTSIKEIFNEIIGKSTTVLGLGDVKKTEPKIILVASASGGVGKTFVSMGLSACLSLNYKKVLYLNAANLQSFHRILENNSVIADSDFYEYISNSNDIDFEKIEHIIRRETFYYLPPFKGSLSSLGVDFGVYGRIAVAAKRSMNYDYIVIDCISGFDEAIAGLIDIAEKVVVVTKQSETSVFATNILTDSINGATGEKYVYVCNDFLPDDDNALISPRIQLHFSVAEYIEHVLHYDHLRIKDLMQNKELQKMTYLFI